MLASLADKLAPELRSKALKIASEQAGIASSMITKESGKETVMAEGDRIRRNQGR